MMALRNLENQQRKVYGDIALATASYTDTLIQKVEQNKALQRRSAVSPIAQQPRSVPPPGPANAVAHCCTPALLYFIVR